jgi:astacin
MANSRPERAIQARRVTLPALCALALALGGCAHGRAPARGAGKAWYGTGAPTPTRAETFRPTSARATASAWLTLPGARNPELVTYEVVDGIAVMDGDMVLGDAATLALRHAVPSLFGRGAGDPDRKYSSAVSNRSLLWPNGVIPYELDASVASQAEYIHWAIDRMNETEIQLRPRTAADVDYVVFVNPGDGGCSATMGRVGGRQTINLAEACGGPSTIHEIMHAAGFMHEHSRADRDAYVTIAWNEIEPSKATWFEKRKATEVDPGPYDYGSIMHYGSESFSRTGNPTIIPHIADAPIGQRNGLSELDRAGISALYGRLGGPTPPLSNPSAGAPVAFPTPGQLGLPLPSFTLPVAVPGFPLPWTAPPVKLPSGGAIDPGY